MHPKQKNTLEKSIAKDGVYNLRKKPDEQKSNNCYYLINVCYKYVLRG